MVEPEYLATNISAIAENLNHIMNLNERIILIVFSAKAIITILYYYLLIAHKDLWGG